MLKINLLLVFLSAGISAVAEDSGCLSDPPQLREIVQEYSQRTGTKFVLDPRVRANVTTFGMSFADMDYEDLLGIMAIHGFTAIKDDDVVYVVPDVVADDMKRELETRDQP